MATIERFEDLQAFKHARTLTRKLYEVTKRPSFSTDKALRDQMRRAAVSVMANIAEGFESRTVGLFVEHLGRAKGSAGEVRAHLYAALDAGHLTAVQFGEIAELATETSSCISGLMKYLNGNGSAYRIRQRVSPDASPE